MIDPAVRGDERALHIVLAAYEGLTA
jgi:hypothetical protein